jgi:hypothetical protein
MDYGTQILRFRSSIPVLSPASDYKSRNSGPHSSTTDTDGDSFLPHKRAKLTHFPDKTRMIPETSHAQAALSLRKETGTHCKEVWMGLMARTGLDVCGKSRHHRHSTPGLSNP